MSALRTRGHDRATVIRPSVANAPYRQPYRQRRGRVWICEPLTGAAGSEGVDSPGSYEGEAETI